MTMLVTGASGFVGAALVRCLLEAGFEVRALVRKSSDCRNLENLDVERVAGDLTDTASLRRALVNCQYLFHVAADYRLWAPNPATIYASNVDGTRNIMLAAAEAGVDRIVYTSSVATLGLHADGAPADENLPVTLNDMIGHYKRSKFLAEAEVRRLVLEQGLPVITVNPSTPIGPGDIKPTPTGRMIADAAYGKIPAYVDTGLNIVHVNDVAQGHLLAMQHGVIGERYILGGENWSLAHILREIARNTHRKPPRVKLPHNIVLPIAYAAEAWSRFRGKGEPLITVDGVRLARKHMYFSSGKAKQELGYQSRPAASAISDAVDWFLRQRS